MINLMTYINQTKSFDDEAKIAIKIQIDNSLGLGWKKEDILLVTNFAYEYNRVKSFVIGDCNYCPFWPPASKVNAIFDLFKQKIIQKNAIYWYHDLAAYQLNLITETELEFDKADMFLPDFGRLPRWSSGSIFFKVGAEDIFGWIKELVYKYKTDEEAALGILTGQDSRVDIYEPVSVWVKGYTEKDMPELKNIKNRIKKANITYNFHSGNIRSNYPTAIKPIRIARFHFKKTNPLNPKPDQIDFFLHGKNKLGIQIVPDRLVKIFNEHGIS